MLVTRRSAIVGGLAAASMATGAGAAICRKQQSPFQVLLFEEEVTLPDHLTAFAGLQARTMPVEVLRLDASGYAGINRILALNSSVLGISSGATLFCLERMGWDHGFRLMARSEHCVGNRDSEACRRELAAFLGAAEGPGARSHPSVRSYQPRRTDGAVHVWAMRKPMSGNSGAAT